jgi:hypothetical protein
VSTPAQKQARNAAIIRPFAERANRAEIGGRLRFI